MFFQQACKFVYVFEKVILHEQWAHTQVENKIVKSNSIQLWGRVYRICYLL